MPRDTKGQNGESEWTVVAEFSSYDADLAANIALGLLESSGIPAFRFPSTTGMVFDGALARFQPVRILVPPDRAEEAKSVLEEQEEDL